VPDDSDRPSLRSRFGLNAANFFQAEMLGVVIPFLNDFLKNAHWRYDSIGVATAGAGLGVLLFNTPAGLLVDRTRYRRTLFAIASLLTGLLIAALPLVPARVWLITTLLFLAGAAQSVFVPLLGALALGLVGYKRLNSVIGTNQSCNHAGNIVAALSSLVLVSRFGLPSIFYSVAVGAVLAAFSVCMIRGNELDEKLASGENTSDGRQPIRKIFSDRRILILLVAIALFHTANAPILPAVGLYVKYLNGTDKQVAETVLTAQLVMIPVAFLAGQFVTHRGPKLVLAIAFWALPLRIFAYCMASTPHTLVMLQTLDGIAAGIYGVAVVSYSAELTRGTGRFNTLMGVFATALSMGGVVGPIATGILIQRLGFKWMFVIFAVVAVMGALEFTLLMPPTDEITMRNRPRDKQKKEKPARFEPATG
jgi:MFS family permease